MAAKDLMLATRTEAFQTTAPKRSARAWFVAGMFLGPALLLHVGFTAYPMLRTFYNSFFVLAGPGSYEYVGFENFITILTDDDIIWGAVRNSFVWGIASAVIEVPLGFLIALALFSRVRGTSVLRVAWFAPFLLSFVVVGPIWLWIYNYDWGAINIALRGLGLGGLVQPWLGNPATALPALIFVTIWMSVGFHMVILLAAIASIPPQILESARIDGAGWWRTVYSIILPLVRPTLVNLMILSFISKMKQFALVWVMTGGGPLWATETVATYIIKRAFHWRTVDLGYPCAIATLWFLVILCATLVLMRVGHRRETLQF